MSAENIFSFSNSFVVRKIIGFSVGFLYEITNYFDQDKMKFNQNFKSKYRRLSIRECARIQTFPDDFIFFYNTFYGTNCYIKSNRKLIC